MLNIKYYPRGLYGENTYIITDEASGLKAVIDPGYYDAVIRTEIESGGELKFVLLTHCHHDHYLCADSYLKDYPAAVFAAAENERYLMEKSDCPAPSMWLREGDVISLGGTELRVIETPGHTEGGICFATDKEIFTGDTLFKLSVGRTGLETGDWDTLLRSITEKLYTLDDDMTVYPGHGLPTSIGYEKKANPFV